LARGWKGDGQPPAIPTEVRVEVARKYITAWETITGRPFAPRAQDAANESALVARLAESGNGRASAR
jgi:hypothetical protein